MATASAMNRGTVVFDSEVYRDYYLVMFRNIETGKVAYYEQYDTQEFEADKVRWILRNFTLVSFNGLHFDMPILALALQGASNAQLKECCDLIIDGNLPPWDINARYGIETPHVDHIDLFDVAPGTASLKIYGGRLHCRRMQDLPITPEASIAPSDRAILITYCRNDLETTEALHRSLTPQLQLREQMSKLYGQDLRSKSDAAIAEAVLKSEIAKAQGEALVRPVIRPGTTYRYRPPVYIGFELPVLQEALAVVRDARFIVADSGKVVIPSEISNLKITIGSSTYRMGIGGLHSTESTAAHVADETTLLVDRDVASYYPAIILQGLYPRHLGQAFLEVYRTIVNTRLKAKAEGNRAIADSLKIVINASFGKMGSKWSYLYSPDLMIQVTMTGQLTLLMLIEWLEAEGIPVVSANTDGVVIKCPSHKEALMDNIVAAWEICTGFDTEAARYKALYSRDVNNYIALKEDGGYKAKGVYTPTGLQKNPAMNICVNAVVRCLLDGTPVYETIAACEDIRQFVTIRTVKGGAEKDGEFLGRAVRWYYSTQAEGTINYKINGYKVPLTEGAKPLMQLPDAFPDDIDYWRYIREAEDILREIGHA